MTAARTTKPRKQLNVYSRETGALVATLTGATPSELLAQAAKHHATDCWEWDGWNRAPIAA